MNNGKLQNAAQEVRAAIGPLPDGYRIEVHPETQSIVVCTDDLGFCITQGNIEHGQHIRIAEAAFPRLKELVAEGYTG